MLSFEGVILPYTWFSLSCELEEPVKNLPVPWHVPQF